MSTAEAPAAIAAPALTVRLPGVFSWKRPRQQPIRGRPGAVRTSYPPEYLRTRATWAGAVWSAMGAQGWTQPPVAARLDVDVRIVGGGKWDADRVLTAVLDALQGGGAIKDDCRAKDGRWTTAAPKEGEEEHVTVTVRVVAPR